VAGPFGTPLDIQFSSSAALPQLSDLHLLRDLSVTCPPRLGLLSQRLQILSVAASLTSLRLISQSDNSVCETGPVPLPLPQIPPNGRPCHDPVEGAFCDRA